MLKTYHCQICGLDYQSGKGLKKHESYCKKYLRACAKFDTIYHADKCEEIRNNIEQILRSGEKSLDEKVDAAEEFARSLFSQSVRNLNYDLKHCYFRDFRANLLSQKYFSYLIRIDRNIHDRLMERWLNG